jgi:hypothetical protein
MTAATSQVEDRFARPQFRKRSWIAAAQRSEERALRQFTLLPFVVEI